MCSVARHLKCLNCFITWPGGSPQGHIGLMCVALCKISEGFCYHPLEYVYLFFLPRIIVRSKKVFVLWWNEEISSCCWACRSFWSMKGKRFLSSRHKAGVSARPVLQRSSVFPWNVFFLSNDSMWLSGQMSGYILADIIWTGDCKKWHVWHRSYRSISCVASAFWKTLGPFWW